MTSAGPCLLLCFDPGGSAEFNSPKGISFSLLVGITKLRPKTAHTSQFYGSCVLNNVPHLVGEKEFISGRTSNFVKYHSALQKLNIINLQQLKPEIFTDIENKNLNLNIRSLFRKAFLLTFALYPTYTRCIFSVHRAFHLHHSYQGSRISRWTTSPHLQLAQKCDVKLVCTLPVTRLSRPIESTQQISQFPSCDF